MPQTYFCGNCRKTYSFQEYDESRFCRVCGTLLRLRSIPPELVELVQAFEQRPLEKESTDLKLDYKKLIESSSIFYKEERRAKAYDLAMQCVLGEKDVLYCEQLCRSESLNWQRSVLVSKGWSNSYCIARGVQLLVTIWNNRFYRHQPKIPRFGDLMAFIDEYRRIIESFRMRDICTFSEADKEIIEDLFGKLLPILQNRDGWISPVSVGKTLPLLAPEFFSFWDDEIAKAYHCYWYGNSGWASKKYVDFTRKMKVLFEDVVRSCMKGENLSREASIKHICSACSKWGRQRSVLKIMDEYNYAKHTKDWVQ